MSIGMLAFVLVLGGLFMFGEIIPEAMRLQSETRRQTGYEAQTMKSGTSEDAPPSGFGETLAETEVLPETPPRVFAEEMTAPLPFRTKRQTFSVELDPISRQWYWHDEKIFRGQEECHMPLMTIPEFTEAGGLP